MFHQLTTLGEAMVFMMEVYASVEVGDSLMPKAWKVQNGRKVTGQSESRTWKGGESPV